MINIAIFSLETDLHAHAIGHELSGRSDVTCHVVLTDALHDGGALHQEVVPNSESLLRSTDGTEFSPESLDVVWWRRVNAPQRSSALIGSEESLDFVSREWRFALQGLMYSQFHGVWVNDPFSDIRVSSSKSLQLRTALDVGLNVPPTIISQCPSRVRAFIDQAGTQGTVVKKIAGIPGRALATVELSPSTDLDDADISLAPAVYQQKVIASHHLRVMCFGSTVICARIGSDQMDWRRDISGGIEAVEIDTELATKLVELNSRLGLRMGVMDIIVDRKGQPHWLEVNPQGQFLFVEALAKLDLTNPFCDFLLAEANGD